MLKDKKESRKPLSGRRTKKGHVRNCKQNIFELVKDIPKSDKSLSEFENYNLNLKYAEILIEFCESKIPDKLSDLEFSENQSLGNLIYGLTQLITSQKYTIAYDLETFHETFRVDFNFKKIKYDWYWYILESKNIHKIKSEELKIGFCHIMQKFGKQTEVSFIKHNYKNFENSIFQNEEYFFETLIEEGEFSEFKTIEEFQESALEPYRKAKQEYDCFINFPIEKFYNYKPKNKPERELKKIIESGLNLDFSIIHRFPDDEIPYTEDGDMVSYSQSFMLIYDWKSNLENTMMERWHGDANNNGVTVPVNYYSYSEGKIEDCLNIELEEELLSVCDLISNLNSFFD